MFSVIMPTYNCEKYVKEAIESVLTQTYTDFELIIVDDGSTDQTFSICLGYAERYNNVFAYSKTHNGVSAARNFGIEKASGTYILFIDSDDSWNAELLQYCFDGIESGFELFVFGFQTDFYNGNSTINYSINSSSNDNSIYHCIIDSEIETLFSICNMAAPWNKVYKKNLLEKYAIRFCESCVYLEDLKFNFDYLQHINKLAIVHKDLYHYRNFITSNQILKRKFKSIFVNADELYRSGVALLEAQNVKLKDSKIIKGILISAYVKEFFSFSNGKTKTERKKLYSNLRRNLNFTVLVKNSREKFFIIYKLLGAIKFYDFQILLLKRRYWR